MIILDTKYSKIQKSTNTDFQFSEQPTFSNDNYRYKVFKDTEINKYRLPVFGAT